MEEHASPMDAVGQDAPLDEGSRLFLPTTKKADT